MTLEDLFNHFEYVSWKRLEGIGLFELVDNKATFYFSKRETLFSDGEIVSEHAGLGERVYQNLTYCISGYNYDPAICDNPDLVTFEVFLADTSQETIDKASEKLRELVNEVHRRSKLMKRKKTKTEEKLLVN
jgi:hypothetical protein